MQAFENYLPQILSRDLSGFILPGLVLFVILIFLCRFFIFALSKGFEAGCDWLEYKLMARKTRWTAIMSRKKKSQTTQPTTDYTTSKTTLPKTSNLNATRRGRIIDAQNVLRRNAEAYSNQHKN